MNLKKIGQSILWIIAGILLLSFLWQYVQRRGGIGAVFGQLFPGLGGGIWHGSVGRQPAPAPAPRPTPLPAPAPPTATQPVPQPAPAPPRTPPVVVPAPPTAPRPVHPEADPNISMNDRLPWENNRVRSEVINALTRDIARVQGMERRWADTMPEVVAVGGVDNYLNLQRERLTRARTFPATAQVGARATAPPATIQPAPQPIQQAQVTMPQDMQNRISYLRSEIRRMGGTTAPGTRGAQHQAEINRIENAWQAMRAPTHTTPQPLPIVGSPQFTPQPSPFTPSPEVDVMLAPRVFAPLPPTVEQGAGAPTRIWDENPQIEFLQ